jgi:hypothetical protein
MSKSEATSKQSRKFKTDKMVLHASKEWDRGKLRSAFRLFRVAARSGDKGPQLNVGYFYDKGIGVRRDQSAVFTGISERIGAETRALLRIFGTIWRDKHEPQPALSWFFRAVKLGDDGSSLLGREINLLVMAERTGKPDLKRAIPF